MKKFKFSILQKAIMWTAVIPLIFFLTFLLIAYLESFISPDLVLAIAGPLMVNILFFLAVNTLLLPVSIFQTVSVFKTTNTYHGWLLLSASFVGPVILYLLYDGLSNAIYL